MKSIRRVFLVVALLALGLSTPFAQPQPPSLLEALKQTASRHAQLLQTNTYESCLEFVQHFLEEVNDPRWGHVGKTAGEGQSVPVGFAPIDACSDGTLSARACPGGTTGPYRITGVSHDAIKYKPTGYVVDLLGNASANSDPRPEIHGPATVHWDLVPAEHWRASNPWIARVPLGGPAPAPVPTPVPIVLPYPGDVHGTALGTALFEDYAAAGEFPNPGMGVWYWRTAWDAAANGLTMDASIKKHRNEWRAILGLPPLP